MRMSRQSNQKKLQTHQKRLAHTTGSIYMLYASMMVGVAECVPLGILQGTIARVLDSAGLDELVLMQ